MVDSIFHLLGSLELVAVDLPVAFSTAQTGPGMAEVVVDANRRQLWTPIGAVTR